MTRVPRSTYLLMLGAALAACSDTTDPTAGLSRAPDASVFAAGGQGQGNGRSALDLIEDDYAAGALDKDNANRYRAYAVHAPEKLPQKYKSAGNLVVSSIFPRPLRFPAYWKMKVSKKKSLTTRPTCM